MAINVNRSEAAATESPNPGTEYQSCSTAISETDTLCRPEPKGDRNYCLPLRDPHNPKALGLELQLLSEPNDKQDLLKTSNFRKESCVDVFQVLCNSNAFLCNQDDTQIKTLLEGVTRLTCNCPKLMAIFIQLEHAPEALYGHEASISRPMIDLIFQQFGIHSGFMADVLGRPDYWSPVYRTRNDFVERPGEVEFFCQHPRWSQNARYDQNQKAAHVGHVAPCSVYMHHSHSKNLTFYLIVASESEHWFESLLRRIGTTNSGLQTPTGVTRALSASPFMIHTLMSSISFEQSKGYVASVRNRLMEQYKNVSSWMLANSFFKIRQVNDYSDGRQGRDVLRQPGKLRTDLETRRMLEDITKNLHLVSQTADSGIANAHQSIKISDKMVIAHEAFLAKFGPDFPAGAIPQTQSAMEYIRDSFYSQREWLNTYKARKDTAMNFVFNMVTQQDSSTNLDISYKMSKDSSSMTAVTILTMVFLPCTFVATVFSSVAFATADSGAVQTTEYLWPFISMSVALSVITWCLWYFRKSVGRYRKKLSLNMSFGRRSGGASAGDAMV